mgnify:FL=1
MMIVRQADTLRVGLDLVDCMTGKVQAKGRVTVLGSKQTTLDWLATVSIVQAEKAIRASVKQDYKRVSYFESQTV